MEKVTIILNEGPSSMRSWNGLRVAAGFVGVDMEQERFGFLNCHEKKVDSRRVDYRCLKSIILFSSQPKNIR